MTAPLAVRGACHCGAVAFECLLDAAAGSSKCDCSICRKTRLWKVDALPGSFRLVEGAEALTEYRFNSHAIEHWFCGRCGIKMYGHKPDSPDSPDSPEFHVVNVAVLDDAAIAILLDAPIQLQDGRHDAYDRPPAQTRGL